MNKTKKPTLIIDQEAIYYSRYQHWKQMFQDALADSNKYMNIAKGTKAIADSCYNPVSRDRYMGTYSMQVRLSNSYKALAQEYKTRMDFYHQKLSKLSFNFSEVEEHLS